MNEIKIPEGHKATILGGTIRIEPIEKPKFQRGDIIATSSGCIIIFDKWKDEISKHKNCIAGISEYGDIHYNTEFGNESEWYHATPEEQQILFDALAKDGKRWNAETLEIEDIPKPILVPESIGIYRCKEDFGVDGDGLYIAFNDNTQLLYYNSKFKCWSVCPLHDGYEKVQCYLQPCKREDLKSGDTAFISRANNFCRHDMYYKKIDESEYEFVRVFDDGVRQVDIKSDYNIRFYKLIPING